MKKGFLKDLLQHDEIRAMNALFDVDYYRLEYSKSGSHTELYEHYLRTVRQEKCNPAQTFSERDYLEQYSDVAAAVRSGSFICGFHHYVIFGIEEGRSAKAAAKPLVEVIDAARHLPESSSTVFVEKGALCEATEGRGEVQPDSAIATHSNSNNGAEEGESCPPPVSLDPFGSGGVSETANTSPQAPRSNAIIFELSLIRQSGLFDEDWYLSTYTDIAGGEVDALEHFYGFGYREGRRPNPYFDPLWYLQTCPDVAAASIHPLTHYIQAGDSEGRPPLPFFNPKWYRETYLADDSLQLTLAHYLNHRHSKTVSPNEHFDISYYLETYPDVASADVDPFEHYLHQGYLEGRNPSAQFSSTYYIDKYLNGRKDINPLIHYIEFGMKSNFAPRQLETEASIPKEMQKSTRPGPFFEEFAPTTLPAPSDVKLLAYYLPQFHVFAENDTWWGQGFTEWTNTARGLPRFAGHYQPRIPRDLGFYSLTDTVVLRRQVELAKGAGLFGFCFYFYWFNGKRLMEQPIEMFLAEADIDFPFCLIWANENWTRRWDGAESEVLISQDYAVEDDSALIAEFARHMRDPRYIRVDGRPLLMLYRPARVPHAVEAIARWRGHFHDEHGEDPIIVMAQGFDDYDPRQYGLDGAIEFPPHKVVGGLKLINHTLKLLDHAMTGQVYDYDHVVASALEVTAPDFPLIRTAAPSWDNDARRQGHGLILHGSTPAKYEAWLRGLIAYARRHPFFGETFVCINAWNEWAEGAYLEPDLHYGAAYLNATARALGASEGAARKKVLLVGHDGFPSGAQHLLLNLGRLLRDRFGIGIAFLLRDDGVMVERYREVGRVDVVKSAADLARFAEARAGEGFRSAIVNTTAAADAVPALAMAGIQTINLVHELPRIMKTKGLVERASAASRHVRALVLPSEFVAARFRVAVRPDGGAEVIVRPQGLYRAIHTDAEARERTRASLGMQPGDGLFLNLGYADLRKGFDLFLQLWRLACAGGHAVHFAWLGNIDPELQSWLAGEMAAAEATGTFHHVPFTPDVDGYYAAADVLVLTSREDPFPSVVLEAFAAGKPAVVFAESGGIPDIITPAMGRVVPYGDVPAMLEAALACAAEADDPDLAQKRRRLIEERFDFADYGWFLLRTLGVVEHRLSVIVPNFNYARYLRERLSSIFDQTAPVYEVIILDDASTDTSLAELDALRSDLGRAFEVMPNAVNSGSVFRQWRRGLERAAGELVWIAEADDASDPTFLARLTEAFRDERVVFAFSDSSAMGTDGEPVFDSYKDYYATVAPGLLARDAVIPAREFLAAHLSVKNLVLNVSSVVWRRSSLQSAMDAAGDDLGRFRMAGDWRIYAEACLLSDDALVAYISAPLNRHRRHATSVTHALKAEQHLAEVAHLHAIIYDRVQLPTETIVAQAAYREDLSEQFGLAAPQSEKQ